MRWQTLKIGAAGADLDGKAFLRTLYYEHSRQQAPLKIRKSSCHTHKFQVVSNMCRLWPDRDDIADRNTRIAHSGSLSSGLSFFSFSFSLIPDVLPLSAAEIHIFRQKDRLCNFVCACAFAVDVRDG